MKWIEQLNTFLYSLQYQNSVSYSYILISVYSITMFKMDEATVSCILQAVSNKRESRDQYGPAEDLVTPNV